MEEIFCLLNTIQGKRIIDSQDDLMILKEKRDGPFAVKLLFKTLVRTVDVVFPHKFIWNFRVRTKVGFFAWEDSWGKVLTLDQLKKKGEGL